MNRCVICEMAKIIWGGIKEILLLTAIVTLFFGSMAGVSYLVVYLIEKNFGEVGLAIAAGLFVFGMFLAALVEVYKDAKRRCK